MIRARFCKGVRSSHVLFAATFALVACTDEKASTPTDAAVDGGTALTSMDASPDAAPAPKAWTMYGYDLANSQYNPNPGSITTTSVANLGERLRILVGGGATSTPVLADGTVYFGAWDGFFYAMDATTGEQRWKERVGKQYVRSTAAIAGDRIYAAADSTLVALSRADGRVLFQTTLTEHPQGFIESSPKVIGDLVILGVASYELNLTKADYTFEGSVVALDATSGAIVWRVPVTGAGPGPCTGGSGVSIWSSAAIDPALGLAYIGTGQTYEAPASTCNDTLLAIHYKRDHQGERVAWKNTYTADDVYVAAGGGLNGLDHDIGGAPNLFRAAGVDAVGVGDKGGTYRVFNRATGQELWRAELKHGNLAQLGGVMNTAAVQGDTIFIASNTWMVFGFIVSGMHAEQDTSEIYALDANTGAVRWSQPLDAPSFGTFAVANGLLFHSTIRGFLYARDVQTGRELWKSDTGGPIGSGINVSQDAVYVSSGFALGTAAPTARVLSYGLSPASPTVIDVRENTYKELTVAQCEEALATLQPDATCRSCLCNCDATATGTCQAGCWAQAPCVVNECGETDFSSPEGIACYVEHCSSKLLPPNVFQESTRSAVCVKQCATSCTF